MLCHLSSYIPFVTNIDNDYVWYVYTCVCIVYVKISVFLSKISEGVYGISVRCQT